MEKKNIQNKNKIWIGEDKIIHVDIVKVFTTDDLTMLLDEILETIDETAGRPNILLNIITTSVVSSPKMRKEVGEKFGKISTKVKKIAIWGGNEITRAVASFIIMSSHLKDMKVFLVKEDALNWLKAP